MWFDAAACPTKASRGITAPRLHRTFIDPSPLGSDTGRTVMPTTAPAPGGRPTSSGGSRPATSLAATATPDPWPPWVGFLQGTFTDSSPVPSHGCPMVIANAKASQGGSFMSKVSADPQGGSGAVTVVTVVHAPACHFCDDAETVLT